MEPNQNPEPNQNITPNQPVQETEPIQESEPVQKQQDHQNQQAQVISQKPKWQGLMWPAIIVVLVLISAGIYYFYNVYNAPSQAVKNSETTGPTVVNGNGTVSQSDKASIIEAKVKMFSVFTSKDVNKIRSYITEVSIAAKDQAQIDSLNKMTDKEVLAMADFIAKAAFNGMSTPDDVRNIFNSKDITWTADIKNGIEHVNILFPKNKDGSRTTIDAGKIGGVWY